MSNPKIYTQKHFCDIAEFIKNLDIENKYLFAQAIAEHFQDNNPKFKVERFFKACGLLMCSDIQEEPESDGQPTEQQELEDLEGIEHEMYFPEE